MSRTDRPIATGYAAEMARAHARLAAVPFGTVETPWGAVQYLDRGDGVPVFMSHGVLGGYDNVREHSITVVARSRRHRRDLSRYRSSSWAASWISVCSHSAAR